VLEGALEPAGAGGGAPSCGGRGVGGFNPGGDAGAGAGNPNPPPHHDCDPGGHGLKPRVESAYATANGPRHFSLASDEEARLVDEINHRQMKSVTEVYKLGHLVGCWSIERASDRVRIVRHYAHRVSVQTGKCSDE